jgi:hypothetical protein
VDRIHKGAKPADLLVEQASKLDLPARPEDREAPGLTILSSAAELGSDAAAVRRSQSD